VSECVRACERERERERERLFFKMNLVCFVSQELKRAAFMGSLEAGAGRWCNVKRVFEQVHVGVKALGMKGMLQHMQLR
jgi:hypothetical protein